MTKAQQAERAEAIAQLRKWIKPGDTVYTILRHVSRSGMQREIGVVVMLTGDDGQPSMIYPAHAVGLAIGARQGTRDGLIIGGCGRDMGFHLVYQLSHVLYGSGYACLGKGTCPSNYHVNYRQEIRCEGYRGRFCWRPKPWSSHCPVPEGWPRGKALKIGGGKALPGPLLSCLTTEVAPDPMEVCPTCRGKYYLPNPEGPERFDLTHTDGYAIHHRWL